MFCWSEGLHWGSAGSGVHSGFIGSGDGSEEMNWAGIWREIVSL